MARKWIATHFATYPMNKSQKSVNRGNRPVQRCRSLSRKTFVHFSAFMKNQLRAWAVLFGIFCIVGGLYVVASSKIRPPEKANILGAWIGLDHNRLYFGRLELDSTQTALFSITYRAEAPDLYSVTNWALKEFDIDFDLVPVNKGAVAIHLRGSTDHQVMVVQMTSPDPQYSKWNTEFTLYKEKEFLTKNQLVKDRIDRYRRKGR
jgi:hypothetical protein